MPFVFVSHRTVPPVLFLPSRVLSWMVVRATMVKRAAVPARELLTVLFRTSESLTFRKAIPTRLVGVAFGAMMLQLLMFMRETVLALTPRVLDVLLP